jgi:hypothetical protein
MSYRKHKTNRLMKCRDIMAVYCENRCSYGLDGPGSIPDSVRIFSSPQRPDQLLGAHPASYPMGTGASFPGGKVAGA